MNKRLISVVKEALNQDNTIAVSRAELEQSSGFTEEYMAQLGLKRNDLKKLERHGLAIRGYANTDTNTSLSRKKSGHQVKWVLVGQEAPNDVPV